MKNNKLVWFGLLALAALAAAAFTASSAHDTSAERAKRGEYLVKIMGCNDCHTPWQLGPNGPEPDMSRMLSGHPEQVGPLPPVQAPAGYVMTAAATNTAFSGPWGISYTANLTPDRETGLGAWTEQNFVDTMRTGRHMGRGRPILPPMPWEGVGKLTDQDLKAVFAYLRTIPAVNNRVPQPTPPAQTVAASPASASPSK